MLKIHTYKLKSLVLSVFLVLIIALYLFLQQPNSFWFDYRYIRFFHILGAILLLGNILTGAFWIIISDIQRSPKIFQYTIRAINYADIIFTAPGALLLVLSGYLLQLQIPELWERIWFIRAFILFVALGLTWSFILIPLQIFFECVSEDLEKLKAIFFTKKFRFRLYLYFVFGSLSAMMALIILFLMITK